MASAASLLRRARPAALAIGLVACERPSAVMPPAPGQGPLRVAERAPGLEARLQDCRPLLYSDVASPELDRPQFVRSASGMERFGEGFAILQDDLNTVGFVLDSGETRYVDLPKHQAEPRRFEQARGNLDLKTDYEAAFVLERDGAQKLFAFGSGTLPPRERIAIVDSSGAARRLEARPLYAALRATAAFSSGNLNVEAAESYGEWLLLVQRGNAERGIKNAIAGLRLDEFLAWAEGDAGVPAVHWVEHFDLGSISGVGAGFSGLSATRDGRLVFTASAEGGHTPHANGKVVGSRLGLLDRGAVWWTPIVDSGGALATLKVEGVVPDRDNPRRYLLTTDPDDPEEPALLCSVELSGDWPAARNPSSTRTELRP